MSRRVIRVDRARAPLTTGQLAEPESPRQPMASRRALSFSERNFVIVDAGRALLWDLRAEAPKEVCNVCVLPVYR